MQRKIKFRGKEINTGKWVYGFYLEQDTYSLGSKKTKIDLLIKNAGVIVQNSKCTSGTIIDKKTLGQYTGLKDKNGKEIYEGDIVKIHKHNFDYGFKKDEIGQIKFIDGAFGFYREESKNEYYFNDLATESGYRELEYYEVIGNIYDNPELLEEGE